MYTLYGTLAMAFDQLSNIVESRIKKYASLNRPHQVFGLVPTTPITVWTNDARVASWLYESTRDAGLRLVQSEEQPLNTSVLIGVYVVPKEMSERQKTDIMMLDARIKSRFCNFLDDFATLVVIKDMER